MDEIRQAEAELQGEFQLFDNWVDRYQYIIDLGRQLPPFPDAARTEANKIKGCQSQVWLVTRRVGDRLEFDAISDSAIVSGLIAILRRVYNGRRAADIAASRPDFIAGLGLDQHLSPTRSNGLHAMIGALRLAAVAAAAA
ncbi:MAG: SufE family protein [Chromatiales bacterium]|jgi:cysteine desulfuration protein SufE|nr:SufE family protein [Chromatiales bacterium]